MREKLIVLVGPTAVGKTKLSIELAKHLNGEIINGDAFQIYRGMDIGTAKVSSEEANGVPHHLIDIRNPGDNYSAADYQRDARQTIHEIAGRGKLPILVGGTGFYVKAAVYDYHFPSGGSNPAYRADLEELAQSEGAEALHTRLRAVDPVSAARIHPNNLVRVIRALEVFHETGRRFSEQEYEKKLTPLFETVFIGLTMNRDLLYQRIDSRIDQMVDQGLLQEVCSLYSQGLRDAQALQAIGYKEFFPYFENQCTLEQAVDQLKRNSRHYAKRQFTWFKGQMNVHWFDMGEALNHFSQTAVEVIRYIEEQFSFY
ncbi:tRNA (adenosine(37)-N6)-dimethylallyltransferase MiaA [Sporolactobacillus pectinivorans]|uniref:tRNA (adenosine(37)-N6)-dimethylallyltransferase MiaA n=1 Tax=Sporolactobacillus pectinivorans TaxID=1591408 RepID=UPI000C26557B|nr:tRNA (adenosine(37)-N6)-dimethylallyltransferase MiaA [Sporolactobacillus pectinivorans]